MSREKAEEMENRLNFLLPATYDRPPSQMILFIFAAGDVDDDGDDDVAYGYFGHNISQIRSIHSHFVEALYPCGPEARKQYRWLLEMTGILTLAFAYAKPSVTPGVLVLA